MLNSVDLNKLRAFLLVSELGGVTAAARALGVTRSAVSQALSALERQIGVKLFHRVGRKLVATREGESVHGQLAGYQAALERALEEVRDDRRAVRGLVRVGLFLGFPRPALAAFVARFAEHHPEAAVQLWYGSHDELRDRLLRGRIDFALTVRPSAESGRKVRSMRLFAQELVLVAGRRWYRRDFDLRHLERTPVIDYYPSEPLIDAWIRHHYRKRPPRLVVRSWAATTDLVLELVLRQLGVGVLPRHLVAPYLARRRLFVVATGRRELVDAIWLHELADPTRSHTLEVFRAELLETLQTTR